MGQPSIGFVDLPGRCVSLTLGLDRVVATAGKPAKLPDIKPTNSSFSLLKNSLQSFHPPVLNSHIDSLIFAIFGGPLLRVCLSLEGWECRVWLMPGQLWVFKLRLFLSFASQRVFSPGQTKKTAMENITISKKTSSRMDKTIAPGSMENSPFPVGIPFQHFDISNDGWAMKAVASTGVSLVFHPRKKERA